MVFRLSRSHRCYAVVCLVRSNAKWIVKLIAPDSSLGAIWLPLRLFTGPSRVRVASVWRSGSEECLWPYAACGFKANFASLIGKCTNAAPTASRMSMIQMVS
jgi:hypothetical protein